MNVKVAVACLLLGSLAVTQCAPHGQGRRGESPPKTWTDDSSDSDAFTRGPDNHDKFTGQPDNDNWTGQSENHPDGDRNHGAGAGPQDGRPPRRHARAASVHVGPLNPAGAPPAGGPPHPNGQGGQGNPSGGNYPPPPGSENNGPMGEFDGDKDFTGSFLPKDFTGRPEFPGGRFGGRPDGNEWGKDFTGTRPPREVTEEPNSREEFTGVPPLPPKGGGGPGGRGQFGGPPPRRPSKK